jgi:hypothetical protein
MVFDRPTSLFSTYPFFPSGQDGDCTLMMPVAAPFTCSTPCTGTDICSLWNGTCAPQEQIQSVGTVRLFGLPEPVSVDPDSHVIYEPDLTPEPFPLPATGAPLILSAAGGAYAPFTLGGREIAPLIAPADPLVVSPNQPLTALWDHAGQGGPARVVVTLALGANGGDIAMVPGSGYVRCNFADVGSGTVSASLVATLYAQGVGRQPLLALERSTVDSTHIAPGCVQFTVHSYASQPLVVN